MAYVAPSTRSTGDLITAAIWNQDVVDNPIALKTAVDAAARVLASYDTNGSYVTTTSALAIIDGTNLVFTVTPTTDTVFILFMGHTSLAGGATSLIAYQIDSGTDVEKVITAGGNGTFSAIVGFEATVTPNTEITITMKWRNNAGGSTLTIQDVLCLVMQASGG